MRIALAKADNSSLKILQYLVLKFKDLIEAFLHNQHNGQLLTMILPSHLSGNLTLQNKA
jgi:hypothetical protein